MEPDVSDEAVAALQAALDHFRRRIAELTAAGIPEDEALRHIVNEPRALLSVPGFKPGDKVWPKEGPMVLQNAPKTILATCRHPVAGDWLWLDDGNCGFGSWAAVNWTTEEPDAAELESRFERRRVRAAENAYGSFLPRPGRTVTEDAVASFAPIRPLPVRLFTGEPERPSVLGAAKGDIIEVIQPDGTHEHYRVASAVPMADDIGTAFQMEAVAPDGT
jgi:hypothetical protein